MKELTEKEIINACGKFADDNIYYSDTEFISNSMLGKLKISPKELARYFEKGSPTTSAMTFGRAFHLAILEPEAFSEQVAIYDGKTKRGKAWDEFAETNKGRDIITEIEFESIKGMETALVGNEEIIEFLVGKKEVPMVWEDSLSSVRCKGKVDILNGDTIVDIKTTQDSSFEVFRRSAYKYGYNRQAAFYLDGFGAKEFVFIVIEKKAPYNIGVYHCSDGFIESGRDEYSSLLMDYKKYFIDSDPNNYEIRNYFNTGIL